MKALLVKVMSPPPGEGGALVRGRSRVRRVVLMVSRSRPRRIRLRRNRITPIVTANAAMLLKRHARGFIGRGGF